MPPSPIRHRRIRASNLDFHLAEAGTPGRPLVVFLHGFPEASFAWEAQLAALADDWHAVAPDLPGCNLSDKSKELRGYRAGVVVRDLTALVEALGHKDFHLVGHDWGAAIAFAWAIARPDMVRSLFILNGAHPWIFWREIVHNPAQAAHSQYINLFRDPARQHEIEADRYARLRRFLTEDGSRPDWFDEATEARYIEAWSQPGSLEGGLNYYRANAIYPATADDPGAAALQLDPATMQVRVPTTVLWGERDHFLLPGCLDGLEQVVPGVRVIRHAGASHWFAHEYPEVVNRQLREHLATHASPKTA